MSLVDQPNGEQEKREKREKRENYFAAGQICSSCGKPMDDLAAMRICLDRNRKVK